MMRTSTPSDSAQSRTDFSKMPLVKVKVKRLPAHHPVVNYVAAFVEEKRIAGSAGRQCADGHRV
jgi:hypothetical protein